MRSVYGKLLIWALATFAVSALAFVVVSRWFATRSEGPGGYFARLHTLEAERAAEAYKARGRAGLADFAQKLDQSVGGRHYFTDTSGRDLIDGAMRANTGGRQTTGTRPDVTPDGMLAHMAEASDGSLRMISLVPPPMPVGSFLPYLGIVVLAISLLSWPLASNLAAPLRTLSQRVDHFGQGDLTVRMGSTRRDEIGDLARSFDRMADRIETLLTAERRLLQDVSHELRSPLARLSFAAELARTGEDREMAAARLRREIDRLSLLVATLLQMTRAEGDPTSWEPRPVALHHLLEGVVTDCRIEAAGSNISVEIVRMAEIEIDGDPELLRRAVENVIRNAVQYSPDRGRIEISLVATEGTAQVSVRDFGPGVPEALLSKIFLPFFRVDDARSDQTGGTGLGLAITQRAISVHRGSIRAVNALPGLLVEMALPIGVPGVRG